MLVYELLEVKQLVAGVIVLLCFAIWYGTRWRGRVEAQLASMRTSESEPETSDDEGSDDLPGTYQEPRKLNRYAVMDSYVLEELRRRYESADASGRIQLLRRLYKKTLVPFEIAQMAVKDPHTEVRQWIARHGSGLNILEEQLRTDPDPFVRACLRENPHVYSPRFDPIPDFNASSHLERLALMRNPKIGTPNPLITAIFDPEDQQLRISSQERKELIFAYVTNAMAIKESHRDDFVDGWNWHETRRHFATLWELASKWPAESGVPDRVYQFIGADCEVKAKTYQQCEDSSLRYAILEGCHGWEDRGVTTLGMNDSHPLCRWTAYRKAYGISSEQLESVLLSEDKEALSGLSENQYLSVEQLVRVGTRLKELGDYLQAKIADRTVSAVASVGPAQK